MVRINRFQYLINNQNYFASLIDCARMQIIHVATQVFFSREGFATHHANQSHLAVYKDVRGFLRFKIARRLLLLLLVVHVVLALNVNSQVTQTSESGLALLADEAFDVSDEIHGVHALLMPAKRIAAFVVFRAVSAFVRP